MIEKFVRYEEALFLKKIGFDDECFGYYEDQSKKLVIYYSNLPLTPEQQKRPGLYQTEIRNSTQPQWSTAAPLIQDAFKWFRETHHIHGFILPQGDCKHWIVSNIGRTDTNDYPDRLDFESKKFFEGKKFISYEEAAQACIRKMAVTIKKKILKEKEWRDEDVLNIIKESCAAQDIDVNDKQVFRYNGKLLTLQEFLEEWKITHTG